VEVLSGTTALLSEDDDVVYCERENRRDAAKATGKID
jgi:hypothetical protein